MQAQDSVQGSPGWEVIRIPDDPRVLYHWNCRKVKSRHFSDVKVIRHADKSYSVSVAAKVAGARMFRDNWSLETLDSFLCRLGFSKLPKDHDENNAESSLTA